MTTQLVTQGDAEPQIAPDAIEGFAPLDWEQGGQKHGIIYVDPPWPYKQRCAHKKTKFGGGAHGNYKTPSLAEIQAMPVGALAADDAVLCMWITGPHLHNAKATMEAWGFRYVETVLFTWVKTYPGSLNPFYGTGSYTGSNAELVLLGIKGKPFVNKGKNKLPGIGKNGVNQVILEPHPRDPMSKKIIHSRKPACVRDRIVSLFGDKPRVEVFAREWTPGWNAVGNQLPLHRPTGAELMAVVPPAGHAPAGKGAQIPLFILA